MRACVFGGRGGCCFLGTQGLFHKAHAAMRARRYHGDVKPTVQVAVEAGCVLAALLMFYETGRRKRANLFCFILPYI